MSKKKDRHVSEHFILSIKQWMKSLTVTEYLLIVMFLIGIVLTTNFIFVGSYAYFNSDTAIANLLAREQIFTGQFFPSEWVYSQDIWTFFINIPMVFLSIFIKDQFLLRTTAVFFQSIMFTGVLWAYSKYIFKNNSLLVFGAIIFSVLSENYMENMFGQAAYGYMSLFTLITFLFLCFSINEIFEIRYRQMIIACLLVGVFCAGGMRSLGTTIIPAISSFVLVYIIDHYNEPYKKVLTHLKGFLKWFFFICIAVFAGFLVFRWVSTTRGFIAGVTNPTLRSAYDIDSIVETFKSVIGGLWCLFGVENKVRLFSVAGITNCIKYVAAIAFMFFFPFQLTKKYKSEDLAIKRLSVFSWSALTITAITYIYTDDIALGFATIRYFQVPMVLQIILSGYYLYKYWIKRNFLIGTISTLVLLLFITTSLYTGTSISFNSQSSAMRHANDELQLSLRERNLKLGYASYWNAYNRSALFNFDPEIIAIHAGTLIPFYHLTSKRYYEPDYYEGRTFLLMTQSEYEAYESTNGEGSIQAILGTPEEIYENNGMFVIVYSYNIAIDLIK